LIPHATPPLPLDVLASGASRLDLDLGNANDLGIRRDPYVGRFDINPWQRSTLDIHIRKASAFLDLGGTTGEKEAHHDRSKS
jgi:hypothetical protein